MITSLQQLSRQVRLLLRCLKVVLPEAESHLHRWEAAAEAIPDTRLRQLALASLRAKRFHAHGGSLYAVGATRDYCSDVVTFIVALQTISDYLDNLCDRTDSLDEGDFRTLHRAMLDAVTPGRDPANYYQHHPVKDDGGYLRALVTTSQESLTRLPGHVSVIPYLQRYVVLYNDLQVYKHLPWSQREKRLQRWAAYHDAGSQGLYWWEFSAAAGSTLAVFALAVRATQGPVGKDDAEATAQAYFPAITGLHILLDYLIDQREDRREGDLNFVSYYRNQAETEARLLRFLHEALAAAAGLDDAPFHDLMVRGLPAMYLSDGKVERQGLEGLRRKMLAACGRQGHLLYSVCRIQRRGGYLQSS